jgi:UDP-3-O-[3-hydroxymyristoyl] glucosamine N-acyltransferase
MVFRRRVLEGIPIDAFISFTAADARVYPTARLGRGVTVFPQAVISSGAVLEDHSFVYHGSVIAHDARIGEYSMVSNCACISGSVTIGKNTYIGAGAVVMEKVSIGDNCIVAAGAVVISDIPDNKIHISRDKITDNHYL